MYVRKIVFHEHALAMHETVTRARVKQLSREKVGPMALCIACGADANEPPQAYMAHCTRCGAPSVYGRDELIVLMEMRHGKGQ